LQATDGGEGDVMRGDGRQVRWRALGGLALALLLTLIASADGEMPPGGAAASQAIPAAAVSLAGRWRFAVDPEAAGERRGWATPEYDDAAWATVRVPHTWNVMPEHRDYEGVAWYRRRFTLPDSARAGHVRLRFEAVFYLARVWLNGVDLGEHEGGYTPFEFDVSGIARPGADNVLAVRVDNQRRMDRLPATLKPDWSFDWWNYGGIVRPVTLLVTSRVFIAQHRIVATPHLVGVDQADAATIAATVTIHNAAAEAFDGVLTGDVLDDASGLSAGDAPASVPVSLAPGQRLEARLTAAVARPRLWHFDHPHLYRWRSQLRTADGRLLHSAQATFGIRSIALRDARLYLNGEPVRLVGLTRHADSPRHGLAETVTVMAADYAELKALNSVLSRPVHYPQARFIRDYADRHGLLLIPEIPAWQLTAAQMASPRLRALARQQLHDMIVDQFNHPSVWAWSVGNEIASTTPEGHAFVRDLVAFAKALDPTRPVGFASKYLGSQPWADATALTDFVLMNQYFGTWDGPKEALDRALDVVHRTWPDKAVIISEFGFEPRWERVGGRPPDFDPARYYSIPPEVPADSEAADRQRRQLIAEQMAIFQRKPFVAGAIFWTYQDYRTPTGFLMGVVDAQRQRRGSWEVLRQAYAPLAIEAVHIDPPSGRTQRAHIVLRTRGPLDAALPAYTLRGYRLQWRLISRPEDGPHAPGELPLPTLTPGTTWSAELAWDAPGAPYTLILSVVRPTGFRVLERAYDAQGRALERPPER
jgi:beta-glucuronidase